jgi:SAM-dependent methyltransferase
MLDLATMQVAGRTLTVDRVLKKAARVGIVSAETAVRAVLLRRVDGQPVPPPKLAYDVVGGFMPGTGIVRYLVGGREAADMIRALLLRNDRTMDGAVLDFGCGSGRVIRHFRGHPGEFVGSDYNPELIGWCQRNLKGFTFDLNQLDPPLHYRDGRFALVYALSVFTHLDSPRQLAWMRELARVTADDGLIIATTHGTRFWTNLSLEERERFNAGETIVVGPATKVGSNNYGTHQSEGNFRALVADVGLTVVDYLPWGAFGLGGQDLWLLRR